MKALLLTSVLLYSCTKYATIDRSAIGTSIEQVEMEISHLREEEWIVGKRKEAEVSRGVTLLLSLPRLREEDLNFLTKEKGVDAWIIRVIHDRGQSQLDLGSLYALYNPPQAGRGRGIGPASRVGIRIDYAASHPSMRFRAFSCPAFGHDRKIQTMAVKGENSPFTINIGPPTSYREKSQLVQLTPSSFNGGHTLVGKFYFEIAPYDSKEKRIFGGFTRVPRHLEVSAEERIRVETCVGVHPERK